MKTFSETFSPRISQASSPSGDVFQTFTPKTAQWDTRPQRVAAEQVQHFKLWNYVAIDRNSTKASSSMPVVGRVVKGTAKTRQQQYLREFYPGLLQSQHADVETVEDNHPLADLLTRINESDWWGSFAYETYMFLQLTGSFVWWAVPNGFGMPAELWNIPPQWVKPEYSRSGELTHWLVTPYHDKRKEFELPPDEIIRGMKKNPSSKIEPLAPGSAGAEWILNSELVEKARHLSYKHGNLQNMMLVLDAARYEGISPDMVSEVADRFMARYQGVGNSYRPIVAPPGIKPEPFNLKPNEMMLNEVSDQIRDFVLALHGVPKGVVGLSHDMNKASIFGANLMWCEHTIQPLQRFLAGCMTEKLAKKFDPSLVVYFEDCRPHDEESERAEWELDFKLHSVTPDERRLHRGREPFETDWSSTPYAPMSSVPLVDKLSEDADSQQQSVEQQSVKCCEPVQLGKREKKILDNFNRVHDAVERQSLRSLRRFWQAVIDDATKIMGKGESLPSVEKIVPAKQFEKQFNKTMLPHWRQMFLSGAEFEADNLGIEISQRVSQEVEYSDELKASMSEFLEQREAGIWSKVLKTTHTAMEHAVQKSLEEGEHVAVMRDRILETLNTSKKHATTIARTEATASLNYGQQALRETEEIPKKIWISTVDGSTRETHVMVDQQVVGNDEPFTVGGYAMMHPGDGSMGAPAEEIVLCRCTSSGVIDD